MDAATGLRSAWEYGRTLSLGEGKAEGRARAIVDIVENIKNNLGCDIIKACEVAGTKVDEYEKAKALLQTFLTVN